MEFLPLLQCSTLLHRSNGFAPNEFLAFPEINLARNGRSRVHGRRRTRPFEFAPPRGARIFLNVDSSAKLFPAARGAHEYVAALVERGSRRAPHFVDFHQAEPTRSATRLRRRTDFAALTSERARFC